jgi:hypothetical protein
LIYFHPAEFCVRWNTSLNNSGDPGPELSMGLKNKFDPPLLIFQITGIFSFLRSKILAIRVFALGWVELIKTGSAGTPEKRES